MARISLRVFLIALEGFTGVSAVGGAIFAVPTLPPQDLQGSVFPDYLIPGLALGLLVGGSMLLAAAALIANHQLAPLLSLAAGLALIIFEVVEAATIGLEHVLQPICFLIGVIVAVQAVRLGRGALWHPWQTPVQHIA